MPAQRIELNLRAPMRRRDYTRTEYRHATPARGLAGLGSMTDIAFKSGVMSTPQQVVPPGGATVSPLSVQQEQEQLKVRLNFLLKKHVTIMAMPESVEKRTALAEVTAEIAHTRQALAALDTRPDTDTWATVTPPEPGLLTRLFRKQYTPEEAQRIDAASEGIFSRAVEAAYRETLNRSADKGGLWHWVAWAMSNTGLLDALGQQKKAITIAQQRMMGVEREVLDIVREQLRKSAEYKALPKTGGPGPVPVSGLGFGFTDPFTGQTPNISPQPAGSNSVLAPSGGTSMTFGGTLSAVGDSLQQFANSDAFKSLLNAGAAMVIADQQKDAAKAAQAAQEQSSAISQMLTLVQGNNAGNQNAATIAALQQQLAQTQQFMMAAQAQAANRQPLSIPAPAAVAPASSTPGWVLPVVIGGVGLLAVGGMMFAMKKRK